MNQGRRLRGEGAVEDNAKMIARQLNLIKFHVFFC